MKETGVLLIATVILLSTVAVANTNGNISSLDQEPPFVNDDIDKEPNYYSPQRKN